jgi:hypothetical protein
MPRGLVKHASGCVCAGVSREDGHVGEQLRKKDPLASSNRLGVQMV